MTNSPEKPPERKDPLANLGKSESERPVLGDYYDWPEYIAYLAYKRESIYNEHKHFDALEKRIQRARGEKACRDYLAALRNLANDDIIGEKNFLRIKKEISLGILEDDKDFRTNIRNDEET